MAPPARQHCGISALRQIHCQRQRIAELVLDQFAWDAAAKVISPAEFAEGRFVL
jgi:hypothetical protein